MHGNSGYTLVNSLVKLVNRQATTKSDFSHHPWNKPDTQSRLNTQLCERMVLLNLDNIKYLFVYP